MSYIILISGAVFVADQVIKFIIANSILVGNSIDVIPDFFSLTYVHNLGAAWSIFEGNRLFLISITFMFLIVIYYFFIKDKKLSKLEKVSYGLLTGGIVGNLIDRIVLGYVIDYLSFNIFGYNFPVFNLADSCIVIAVILIIIDIQKGAD